MQKSAEIQTGELLEEATHSSTSPYFDADLLATRILADRNAPRYAARNPRLPAAACCALGVMGWWLTKGSIGSASRKCNTHAHWCLTVTKKVETRCGYTPATPSQTLVEVVCIL